VVVLGGRGIDNKVPLERKEVVEEEEEEEEEEAVPPMMGGRVRSSEAPLREGM
jgi:hypothetical protein